MFGGGSVQLARVFGIRIGVSSSWFLVLFLMIYWLSGLFGDALDVSNTTAYIVAVVGALLFFCSLALHELGHALAARHSGIDVLGIDLWLFGGVAKLSRDSRTPGEEFRIAASGPAVTAAIALLCLGGVALFSHLGNTIDAITGDGTTSPALALVTWLASVNGLLLVVNLLPGFPLDGGRIARAIAWRITNDQHKATRIAGRMGQGIAYTMIGVGLLWATAWNDPISGIWFMLLGWFMNTGARSAVLASAFSERIEGVTAADLMEPEAVAVPGTTTALAAHDEFFGRYGLPWFPVVDPEQRVLGLLSAAHVDGALASGRPTLPVDELVEAEADARIDRDTPLESLLSSEPLRRFGALIVVDGDGRLCGLVTLDQIRRALAANVS